MIGVGARPLHMLATRGRSGLRHRVPRTRANCFCSNSQFAAHALYVLQAAGYAHLLAGTRSSQAGVCEGHAFVVEAAVSLGVKKDAKPKAKGGRGKEGKGKGKRPSPTSSLGVAPESAAPATAGGDATSGTPLPQVEEASKSTRIKPGLNIFRFANRIPLLFEAGGDVVTRTAVQRIRWSSYKIDHKQDRIGVFVSIVSTRMCVAVVRAWRGNTYVRARRATAAVHTARNAVTGSGTK